MTRSNSTFQLFPGPNTTKCTAGYPLLPGMDYIDLFCGSEGTLGIVLEAELTLLPIPDELFSAVIFFGGDDDALDAVDGGAQSQAFECSSMWMATRLELIRGRYSEIPSEAAAALLIEAEGSVNPDEWADRLSAARALTEQSWFAVTSADRERFRKLRHSLPELVNATVLQRGFMKMGTDYAVPLPRSREMLIYYRAAARGGTARPLRHLWAYRRCACSCKYAARVSSRGGCRNCPFEGVRHPCGQARRYRVS